MDYFVRHRTSYRYFHDVSYSCHLSHLILRDTANQTVRETALAVSPSASRRLRRTDDFGNDFEWFAIDQPHHHLEVLAESRVTVSPVSDHDPTKDEDWNKVRRHLCSDGSTTSRDVVQYTFDSPLTAFHSDVPAYAVQSFPSNSPLLSGAKNLMNRIHKDFRYDPTATDVSTPLDHLFEIRAGVCQDLAHVGIACMRSLGLPARYVSGYLLTQPPPDQSRLLGADASHAWFSVWTPRWGWIDLDPTNDVMVSDTHVTASWGRDYSDVAPLNGIITGGGDHTINVSVDVIPV